MKKLLWILGLCLVLPGCRMTLLPDPTEEVVYETFGTRPVQEDTAQNLVYVQALDYLRKGEFAQARDLFLTLGDYKDTAAYLDRFIFLEDVLLRTESFSDTEGVSCGSVEYHYDGWGRVAQENHITPEGGLTRVTIQDDGTIRVRQSPTGQYMETFALTGDSGRTLTHTQEIAYMDGYNQITTCALLFDAEGRLAWENGTVSRMQGNRSTTTSTWKGTYTYNELGQRIRYEKEYTWGIRGVYREAYTYDAAGNLILLESVTQLPGLSEGTREVYTYDENGNKLTMERVTLRNPGEENETLWDDTRIEYTWENGKLIRETVTLGGITTVTDYVYGDYLSYNAEKERG